MMDRNINEPAHTIYAKSMKEIRDKLYDKYQSDYEITNKKQVLKSRFFGLFNEEGVEVTYVVKRPGSQASSCAQDSDSFMRNKDAFLRSMAMQSLDPTLNAPVSPAITAPQVNNAQLNEIKKSIEELKSSIEQSKPAAVSGNELHPSIEMIQNLLSDNDFSIHYCRYITEKLKGLSLEQLEDSDYVQRSVIDWIGESINIAPEKVHRTPHVVIIVGPTGVGKTTTLVKLAAQYVMSAKKQDRKVELCFITTDTMRVGAQEQLAKFGSLFNLQVLKAENASDVQKIYEDVKDHVDAIFIDTSGYSPNDSAHIGSMKETLDVPGMNPDVYLAVMASTKSRDLINIMRNYEPFGYNSVIITKCDESNQYGNVISVVWEKNKNISYLTTGQKAAGCIEKANVFYFLIRMMGFKVDRIHIEDKFGVN